MTQATATNSATASALLFLHAQTPLHPGSGTALGAVDLPVQRERHTGWPTIPGSSLKGILRDAVRAKIGANHHDLLAVFGPEPGEDAGKYAGALVISDARILAFPVRSLRGVFAWVTCPAVLQRMVRDLSLLDVESPFPVMQIQPDRCFCAEKTPLLTSAKTVVLEEFEFQPAGRSDEVAKWIAERALRDEFSREQFMSHFVILNDDDFTHFVRHSTEVVARIALEYETKTVKEGALFYQEYLPAETLFYAVLICNKSRRSNGNNEAQEKQMSARQVLDVVKSNLPPVLQVGADETTGKGFCSVKLWEKS